MIGMLLLIILVILLGLVYLKSLPTRWLAVHTNHLKRATKRIERTYGTRTVACLTTAVSKHDVMKVIITGAPIYARMVGLSRSPNAGVMI